MRAHRRRSEEQASARRQLAEAAAQERARIAREPHDVVAHNMSVIAVQTGVALQVVHRRPEVAEQTLRSFSESSRAGRNELRQLVRVLRADNETKT